MIKLFKKLRPFSISIILVIILVFIQTITDLYLPTLMSDIVDTGIVNKDIDYILDIGKRMVLITILGTISAVYASYLSSKIGMGFGTNLRNEVFTKVESFSLHEFDKTGTSSLITRTTNDITQVQTVLITILRMFVRAPIMAVGGIIMAVSKDAKLSLIFVVVIVVLAILISLIGAKSIPLYKLMQVKLDKLNLVLRERLTGIRVIRAFNRVDKEKSKFNDANLDLVDTAIKVNKLMAILMPLMMLIMNFTNVAIIWFGSIRIDNGVMQVGDLMAFIQYAMQIMFSLVMFTMMFILVPRASASAVRINEVLDTNPDINDSDKLENETSKRGYLEFKNVIFSYHGAEEPVLKGVSFCAKPGEVTAIIGGTGCGKSTLVNLIPRFYDVTNGSILVDGVDIKKITQQNLRSKIGLVPQKAVLFTGSISENIRFGNQGANDEQVRHAANIAQATEFIGNMKEGFDSYISQGGTNLSGGQKQRISIARALVRKPEIYVFDDSFSALDFKTDAKLRQALKKETVNDTVIIVAQRVTTVMDANRIIVLEDGNIAGMGTHKELLKSCSVYQEIVSSQLSKEEI
ncbi:ABC transporter ATP-binding protein [Tepidibacter hydrothermalis]|uniref:ABC transporter ATP-binding protein n=1 Tax=Tepidibacter hydrothermalis TaxID=3036126 RepID=A0ABY8E7K2_9FIRM|nr:ABC transporter ATP-binding protein [Tepidibacter hydrothermalis]WFD08868.1 ABC transporter ATP-binding protein [Tepidibacter hydrothermalis]